MKWFLYGFAALALLMGGVGQASAGAVYLLSTGISAEDTAVVNLLQANGQTVTVGPYYQSFAGPVPSGYNAVLLMQNNNGFGGPIPASGQTALLNYIQAGGGLLTSEWTVWTNGAEGNNTILDPAIPVTPTGSFDYSSPITYTQSTSDSVLSSGVPSSFTFAADNDGGTETEFQPKTGATVFYSSSPGFGDAGGGLIGWDYGSGRVISFSTLAGQTELGDSNYAQLFSNAVDWVEGASGPAAVPEPASLTMLCLGALGLAGYRWRKRKQVAVA